MGLVTAAVAALSPEPKESGEGWPAAWRAGDADLEGYGGILVSFKGLFKVLSDLLLWS